MLYSLAHNYLIMDSSGVVLTIAVVIVCIGWTLRARTESSVHRLPLPPEPGRAFRDWINDFGLTFRIQAALKAPDILVLSDPLGIAHIVQKKIYDYHHSKIVRPRVARLLGRGLGWVEGESEHKRMRRLVTPSLTAENIKAMSVDLTEAASKVLSDLVHTVQSDGGRCKVNVLTWTNKATLNIIGRVAFMHDFESGNSAEARDILGARRAGVSAISKYTGFLTLMQPFSLALHGKWSRENITSVMAAPKAEQKDLLSRLLIAVGEKELSEAELYEHISTFIIAGQETTSQTIAFSLMELARHPKIQQRLREELKTISGEPTYEDFQSKLPYLDAVLRETLRIYPPLPYFERVAMKPDVIPLRYAVRLPNGQEMHEVHIQAGQTVIIPTMSLQRLDSVWGDGEVFRPERWLEQLPPQEKLCSGWSNTLSFSDGPRACPGQRLAIFEYKVILSALVSRFVMEDTGAKMLYKIASSLQPLVEGEQEKGFFVDNKSEDKMFAIMCLLCHASLSPTKTNLQTATSFRRFK
ncbi:hypothetical protein A0H81_05751 [Grifola frondosa]|uniref:Cytochrome P450 n=1 Tax=Grifola frondosa TaxID=5627 RepID=A0A1C7MCS0_GRIFR|nr:hypothetical protein A0H81_05751 [Grifola frondosa]